MPDIRNYLLLALLVACVVLGLGAWHYKTRAAAVSFALDTQNKAINQQKQTAKLELDAAKKRVADLEEKLKQGVSNQDKQDEKTLSEITISGQRDVAPVSVRYITRYARSCDPRTEGPTATDAKAGGADTREATGVLGPAAERSFKSAIAEVKTLQAAFNSCKQDLQRRITQ